MEDKKKCPYCGEDILFVAKKCKHCGEWLENPTIKAVDNRENEKDTGEELTTSFRRAIVQSQLNETSSKVLFFELLIISILIGYATRSFLWGISGFVILIILMGIPKINTILLWILSLIWGLFGFGLGFGLTEHKMSPLWGFLIALITGAIVTLLALGIHFRAKQNVEDS